MTVTYTGRESHAAVAPYLGVNAADAVTVAQVAIGLLRQQLAPGQMTHGIVTEGGSATNVIPGRAAAVHDAGDRQRVAPGAGGQDARLLRGRCGGHRLRIRDRRGGAGVRRAGPRPVAGRGIPRRDGADGPRPVPADVEAGVPLGSTDMGNVTQLLPGIHPVVGIDAGER